MIGFVKISIRQKRANFDELLNILKINNFDELLF